MRDNFKRERKMLRKKWASEDNGKGDKGINRKICRKRLKQNLRFEMEKEYD